ncbi:MAG: GH3 auxin-responsive promoter family protein [Porphyromonas sp.]|nr:GH3 auxin-responsive promoter family protein [Porphyromonas sp.]
MDLLTKILRQATKHRVRVLNSYAQSADAIQEKQLKYILNKSKETAYLSSFISRHSVGYEKFKSSVPVVEYEALAPYIERMLRGEKNILSPYPVTWMAKSSGTSNDRSKYIPVPKPYLKENHYKAGSDVVWSYLAENPNSRLFSSKGFVLGGSHAPTYEGSGIRTGDVSAILVQNMPSIGEWIRVPSKKILLMGDWEAKLEKLIPVIAKADVGSISGVPSWLLMVIKRVLDYTGAKSVAEIWSNIEVFFHGGISFDPYRAEYKSIMGKEIFYRETYNASEGFFALQDDSRDPGMLLLLDHAVFYEFWALDAYNRGDTAAIVPLSDVKIGVPYAMIITTMGGLFRYIIGDVVEFTSVYPHKIKIVGRTKSYINAFGEELMVHNADKAIEKACAETGAKVSEYTAAPIVLAEEGRGYHHWLIEFYTQPASTEQFAEILDKTLREINSDYDAKRFNDYTLLPLKLSIAAEGTFHQWLDSKGKLGGQHKVPRLSNNTDILNALLEVAKKNAST